jgi:hypothetical protein
LLVVTLGSSDLHLPFHLLGTHTIRLFPLKSRFFAQAFAITFQSQYTTCGYGGTPVFDFIFVFLLFGRSVSLVLFILKVPVLLVCIVIIVATCS